MTACSGGCRPTIGEVREFKMYVGPIMDVSEGVSSIPDGQTPTTFYLCAACEKRWRSTSDPARWVEK